MTGKKKRDRRVWSSRSGPLRVLHNQEEFILSISAFEARLKMSKEREQTEIKMQVNALSQFCVGENFVT